MGAYGTPDLKPPKKTRFYVPPNKPIYYTQTYYKPKSSKNTKKTAFYFILIAISMLIIIFCIAVWAQVIKDRSSAQSKPTSNITSSQADIKKAL